jgi:hypothetical protein
VWRINAQLTNEGGNRSVEAVGMFRRGHTVRTAPPTALVVGTVLCAVNPGAILIAGEASTGTWVRMAINYLVPFLVASVGYLGGYHRGRHR